MTAQERMEFLKHCPYDAMGDFTGIFGEQNRQEDTAVKGVTEKEK